MAVVNLDFSNVEALPIRFIRSSQKKYKSRTINKKICIEARSTVPGQVQDSLDQAKSKAADKTIAYSDIEMQPDTGSEMSLCINSPQVL